MLYWHRFFIKINMNNLKPLSGGTFFLRIFGGIAGGIAGTVVMMLIYFMSIALLPTSENNVPGITSFTLIAMILLSTLATNMISSQIIAVSDKEKYKEPRPTLINIFILNLVLFVFSTPLYLLSDQGSIQIIAAFHLLISAQMSALLMEIFAEKPYPLIGTYGIALGGMAAFSIVSFAAFSTTETNSSIATLLLFIAMPLVWGLIEFFKGLSEIAYTKINTLYNNPQTTDN